LQFLQPSILEEITLHECDFALPNLRIPYGILIPILRLFLFTHLNGSGTIFQAIGIIPETGQEKYIDTSAAPRD
jgi:hypothetical protein